MEQSKHGLEIERKFLLKCLPVNIESADRVLLISQFYVEEGNHFYRIRQTKIEGTDVWTYDKTTKLKIKEGVFDELIEPLTTYQFSDLYSKASKGITKYRHEIHCNGLKWEIDEFIGMNLVVAEIELPYENFELELPDFIKNELILEVTQFKEFSNYNLSADI